MLSNTSVLISCGGYYAMLEKIDPETIICFGTPFPEMQGNIVTVDYRSSRKVVR